MRCMEQSEFCNVSLKWGIQLVWSADLPSAGAHCTALLPTARAISLAARTHTVANYTFIIQKLSLFKCYQMHLLANQRAEWSLCSRMDSMVAWQEAGTIVLAKGQVSGGLEKTQTSWFYTSVRYKRSRELSCRRLKTTETFQRGIQYIR